MEKIKRNLKTIFAAALIAFAVVVWQAVFYFESRQNLLITFFDVGQGDAIFIEAPNGNQVLIDGGPDDSVLAKLGEAMPFWDRTVELIVLTHPEKDHIAGLLEVLKRYRVQYVLWTGVQRSTAEYREWMKLLEEKGPEVIIAHSGERLHIGRGAELDILAPFENLDGASVAKTNNTSVVARLRYGHNSILFMGDAEKSVERRLAFESRNSSFVILNSDVLKVGHHGSKTSTDEEFLKAASPEIAVISLGKNNRYGHPNQEVVERISGLGIKIFRTDVDGDITFVSDGRQFVLEKER